MIFLPAIGEIVPALFALLFMVAWYEFGNTLAATLRVNLPIIGNVIGNAVADVLEATYSAYVGWFDGGVHWISQLVLGPVAAVENVISQLENAGANTYNAIWSVTHRNIPAAISIANAWTNQVGAATYQVGHTELISVQSGLLAQIDSLRSDIISAYNSATAYAAAVGQEVLADAENLYNSAISQLDTARAFLLNQIAQEAAIAAAATASAYAASTGYAADLFRTAEGDIDSAIVNLEGYAQSVAAAAVGALVTDIDNTIGQVLGGIYTDVDQAISDVIGIAGTADADVIAGLRAIPLSVPFDIAGVVTLAGATTLTLARYLRDCGIPNCKNLSQFGQDLQALFGVVEDASFIALLAELIHNPSGAAGIIDDLFGGIIRGAESSARELLSI